MVLRVGLLSEVRVAEGVGRGDALVGVEQEHLLEQLEAGLGERRRGGERGAGVLAEAVDEPIKRLRALLVLFEEV